MLTHLKTHPTSVTSGAQQPWSAAPFPIPTQEHRDGDKEGGEPAFFANRQLPIQKKSSHGFCLLGGQSGGLSREEVLPPASAQLAQPPLGHTAKFRARRTNCLLTQGKNKHGLYLWRQSAANLSTAGGETPRRANLHAYAHTHTRTHTPFTGATMHRDTKVTTSINTSHYEYCFQREAIHGIKTSTE